MTNVPTLETANVSLSRELKRGITERRRVGLFFAGIMVLCIATIPASAATRIKFPRGSFCGNYSGNYRNGREFVLNLDNGQRFTVTNTGVGVQTNWSVRGPSGHLEGFRVNRSTLEYFTEARGNHYVYVTSTASPSAVQFCAY